MAPETQPAHAGTDHAARTPPAPNDETDPRIIPSAWLTTGHDEPVQDGETRYYPVLYTVERQLASDPDVLAGRKQGRAEEWTVHVLYVRRDGQRRVSRDYDARVTETGTHGVEVTPQRFASSISVDGHQDTPHSAPRTDRIETALVTRHSIDPTEADA